MPTDAQARAMRVSTAIDDFVPADSGYGAECRILLPVFSTYTQPNNSPEFEIGSQHLDQDMGIG